MKPISKDIKKFHHLIKENLGKTKHEIKKIFGNPSKKSDNEFWSYRKFHFSLFNNEIIFIFEDDRVIDISTNKYFLWIEVKSIFYMEFQNPEYKEISFF